MVHRLANVISWILQLRGLTLTNPGIYTSGVPGNDFNITNDAARNTEAALELMRENREREVMAARIIASQYTAEQYTRAVSGGCGSGGDPSAARCSGSQGSACGASRPS